MKKLLLLLTAAAFTSGTFAEGYQVNNFSARQAGMANVGVAMKLGSESIYFNPAATAFQSSKFDISVGATGVLSYVTATALPTGNDYRPGKAESSDNKMSTPLHLYVNYKPSDRWAIGLGFYTPNGSSVNWGDNWTGAHLVQKINLAAYTFQPTVSFKITDRLSVGAGLMLSWGNFDLSRSMLPVGAATNRTIAGMLTQYGFGDYAPIFTQAGDKALVSAKLEGSTRLAAGVNLGIYWDINDKWSIAMNWRSRMDMKVKTGTAGLKYLNKEVKGLFDAINKVQPMIPALDQGTFHTELPLPATVTWGVSFRPTDKWQLAVDLQWIGWSAYKDLNVVFNEKELAIEDIYSVKNYSNSISARFGAEYKALDWLQARVGIYFDESPVRSDYLNPETPSMTKIAYSAGLTFNISRRVALDLSYCLVTTADPERTGLYPYLNPLTYKGALMQGKTEAEAKSAATEVFARNYKLHAHVLSFGMRFNF